MAARPLSNFDSPPIQCNARKTNLVLGGHNEMVVNCIDVIFYQL